MSRIVKIIELSPAKVQSNSFTMEVNLSTAITPRKYADNNNYVVSLESNGKYNLDSSTLSNQLYMSLLLLIDDLLNSLA